MQIVDLFLEFLNKILSFEIMGIPLSAYVFTIAVIEFVIYMINALKDH